ncbi:MAG: hypothetical protein PVH41_04015 [Anaerolineae bacterium]|jgi:hypothetical protein
MNKHEASFEAYSYRTSSRFGSRVRVFVDDGNVTVTGPRVGVLVHRAWIVAQVALFWATIPALVAAAALWDWRFLALALGLQVVHWALGTFGAVSFWELANVNAFTAGRAGETTEFRVSDVEDVRIGRGWARRGLWLAIPLYVPGLNQMSKGYCVSFEAPDRQTGRDAVYALHMRTEEEAETLAELLGEQ